MRTAQPTRVPVGSTPRAMMAVFGLIESGCVVDAAATIVTALGSCRCDKAREFLRDALQVVAQLGGSPEEESLAVDSPVDGGLWVCRTRAVGRSFGGVRWHR